MPTKHSNKRATSKNVNKDYRSSGSVASAVYNSTKWSLSMPNQKFCKIIGFNGKVDDMYYKRECNKYDYEYIDKSCVEPDINKTFKAHYDKMGLIKASTSYGMQQQYRREPERWSKNKQKDKLRSAAYDEKYHDKF